MLIRHHQRKASRSLRIFKPNKESHVKVNVDPSLVAMLDDCLEPDTSLLMGEYWTILELMNKAFKMGLTAGSKNPIYAQRTAGCERTGRTLSKDAVSFVANNILSHPRVQRAILVAVKQDEVLTDIIVEHSTALANSGSASVGQVDPLISDREFEYFIDSVLELVWKKISRAISVARL